MAEAGVQTTASSMQETSPSWRLHVPRGASALDVTSFPAKHCHGGSPTATGAQGLGKAGTVHEGSRQGAAYQPRLLDAAFRVNCLSWGWVLPETLIVDALSSQGSAGPIPSWETPCSVLERSEYTSVSSRGSLWWPAWQGRCSQAAGACGAAHAPQLSSGRVGTGPRDWREQLPRLELRAEL